MILNPPPSVGSSSSDVENAPAAEASNPPLGPTVAGAVFFDPGPCGFVKNDTAFLVAAANEIQVSVSSFSISKAKPSAIVSAHNTIVGSA